ncbi:MAG: hypothetical protein LH631_12290 [Alkalinema sp. CAN_BIN05]|nr:hypothetical protein [Alkalinema sp. CAN_BIN05]
MIQLQQSPLTINPIATHSNPLSTHQPTPSSSFVGARSSVDLSNFSHRPNSTSTFTDTQVTLNALLPGSMITANAVANAVFIGGTNVPLNQTIGIIDALSVVEGSGFGYEGKSIARTNIKGLDFYISPKETFTFNFQGTMSLTAEGDRRRQREFARSKTTLSIYGTDSCGTQTLLDQLSIKGKQYNNRNSLSVGTNNLSKSFKLNIQSNSLSLGSNDISFNGTYSRTFKDAMRITVVETQQTIAKVSFRGLRSA